MRKLIHFMHVSLDGFVAGPKGEMDWITVDEEIFEYAGNQTDQADTALYGRVTYQIMEAYWPTAADQPNATKHDRQHAKWYNQVDKVVISQTMRGRQLKQTTIISENVGHEVSRVKQSQGRNIVIFGSPSVGHTLMQEKLIDVVWIFVNPIILGEGIPMFKDMRQRVNLNLVDSHAFKSGVVCLHYETKW